MLQEKGQFPYEFSFNFVLEIIQILSSLIFFVGQSEGGCDCFQWIEPEICARSKEIIPGLFRRINKLEFENQRMTDDDEENQGKIMKIRGRWSTVFFVFMFVVMALVFIVILV